MKMLYACEMRFVRAPDGTVHCPTGQFAYDSGRYAPFLEAFDEVMVFARVFDGDGGRGSVTGPGVSVFPVPAYQGIGGFVRKVPKVVAVAGRAARHADLAFCRVPGIVGGSLAKACRARGVPYVVQVIGDPAKVLAGHPDAGTLVPKVLAADLRWLTKNAAAATYVTRDYLQAHYPPGTATEATWFSDIDLGPEAFVSDAKTWSEGPIKLVAVGKMEQHYKGIDVLIEATALLVERGVDVQVRVVGDGKQRRGYEKLATERGVDGVVQFVGTVSAGDGVREQLDWADIFAMPSRTEGLPRALLEAMARGLPAVASNVGGIPQLMDPDGMVPVGDPYAFADKVQWLMDGRLDAQAARNLELAREYAREALEPRRVAWYRGLRQLL